MFAVLANIFSALNLAAPGVYDAAVSRDSDEMLLYLLIGGRL
jgi:hypothetical protein